jgi:hypothetical protein
VAIMMMVMITSFALHAGYFSAEGWLLISSTQTLQLLTAQHMGHVVIIIITDDGIPSSHTMMRHQRHGPCGVSAETRQGKVQYLQLPSWQQAAAKPWPPLNSGPAHVCHIAVKGACSALTNEAVHQITHSWPKKHQWRWSHAPFSRSGYESRWLGASFYPSLHLTNIPGTPVRTACLQGRIDQWTALSRHHDQEGLSD